MICEGHDRQPAAIFARGSVLAARVTAAWDRQSQKCVWWVWMPTLVFLRADRLEMSQIGSTSIIRSLQIGILSLQQTTLQAHDCILSGNGVLLRHGPLSDGAWNRLDLLRLSEGLIE
jgi:hypothetical protein